MAIGGLMSGYSGKMFGRDFAASFVVFLVAMPLCMGIAVASGVPPEMGLMTGIIGGLVVGSIAGSPLQVSGPAAGLAVIVYDIIQKHGIESLGPILMLAGLIQLGAGVLKLGQWFRGVSPAVVHGMLAGIGALIVVGQIHVLMDETPYGHGLDNLTAIPGAFIDLSLANPAATEAALAVGLVTILAMMLWDKYKPESLRLLPGALIGVIAGALTAGIGGLAVKMVSVPENIFASISLPGATDLSRLGEPAIILTAIAIAFIASAETLLSAAAVDRMQDKVQTRYNKELGSQGVGNFLCGVVGALPMTGVIVRSSANVQAGAETRASTIMHGAWMLGFVALLPFVLALVPTAALAGVLVVTGWKLVKLAEAKKLFNRYGVLPAVVWATTFVLVVAVDLLTGVLVGLALSMLELLPHARKLGLTVHETEHGTDAHEIRLEGSATVVQTGKIAKLLDRLPKDGRVRLNLAKLHFVDHTTVELIADTVKRKRRSGLEVQLEDNPPGRHDELVKALA